MRPTGGLESTQSFVSMPSKIEEDQTRTVRPAGGEESTQVEELDIDFRVFGLSHAVVNDAEHFRVQEFVEKRSKVIFIEKHFKPTCSRITIIRELCNVELFELCVTIPNVQCSECLLYWNQGIIYCTCGQFLIDSEFRRKCHKLRLDALSIPNYVTKKGPTDGARHSETEVQK